MPNYRTKKQNNRFWAIAAKLGLTDEDRAGLALDYSKNRTDSTSKLYVKEFEAMNNYLDSLANPSTTPRRTGNYRRAKTGNVDEILSQDQRDLIGDLCREGNINDTRLAGISRRACQKDFPITVKQGQKVIEALKNIISREAAKTASAATSELKEVA